MSNIKEQLEAKIKSKKAVIGIIGLGYVGLPLAVEYASAGFKTIGFDVSKERVEQLNAGQNYIDDVDSKLLKRAVQAGKFKATTHPEDGYEVDVFYICVPTPIDQHKNPQISYVESASEGIAGILHAGQLIILKSTTYPNTTEGVVLPILQKTADKTQMKLGVDYFLAFSPERIDPGNKQFTTANTPVVVGGVTKNCTAVAGLALSQIVTHVHKVSSPKVGEMEKLLENIYRSVNIALVNEMARLCDRIGGISLWEVVEAAATKPFGYMPFFPGPGLGGHCIPIDPYYLAWFARKADFETSFITLSARVNEDMPFYVVDLLMQLIAEQPIRMKDAKVLLLGVAFKKNVDDIRHSPAIKVIELLKAKGIRNIDYADPHVSSLNVQVGNDRLILQSTNLSPAVLKSYNVGIIITDHDDFDWDMIVENLMAIVDTRNACANYPEHKDKIKLIGGG